MAHSPEVTVIVAAAGYGKSTALEAAKPRDGVVHPARLVLREGVPGRGWVGVDDLHELTDQEQIRVLDALADLPDGTRFAVASRQPLAPVVRARLRGRVRERTASDLALAPYDVHRVLADEYGVTDPELPVEVHALTAGWPALVHHAAAVLARDPGAVLPEVLAAEHAPARHWLLEEVTGELPRDGQDALAAVAGLGGVTEDVLGGQAADLEALGVLVRLPGAGREGLLDVVPALARCLPSRVAQEARDIAPRLLAAGLPFGAARAAAEAGDLADAMRLVAERGEEMLRGAHHAGVVEIVASAPPALLTPAVQQVRGDALRLTGDLAAATRAFRPLTTGDGPVATGVATKVAAMHYAAGRYQAVLDALDRGRPGAGEESAHQVEWLALRVHARCSLGRTDEAAVDAEQSLALADATGDPVAGAAAHLAMARVSSGARKEAHHEQALRDATASRDVITAARVLVNHAFHLLASARYDEACHVARAALQAADTGSATGRRASALHNLAEALAYVGEYDEARWHLDRAVALCRRLGPGRTALGLLGLAEIDRAVGQDEHARPRFLEAVELARGTGETQVLVPALAGLARIDALADAPPDRRDRARDAAAEALTLAGGALRPVALTAAGWVSLADGDRQQATARARDAVAAARDAGALDMMADALELEAACAEDPDEARTLLTRALSIWSAGGANPRAAGVELTLATLERADAVARSRARDAARELQRIGVLHVHGVPVSAPVTTAPVEIAVLGGFRVRVGSEDVPVPAWRSRQARTLVKILAARRGRPATRAWLCETLWPDDDPAKTGHRLSVLLASVRGVLDPDRRWPSDHYVAADLDGIRLDLRHVAVDAETLIRDADVAAALMEDGEEERAREILAEVDRRYTGDAFEDETGEEWADGLREEARAAWHRSVRRLSVLVRRAGRPGDAQTLLVRLLTADPYDEPAHLQLVRSLLRTGRRGEARRAFARWQRAMADIGAPLPDPRVLEPVVTSY